ncbi:hypothetical protein DSAG12_04590 [Promethearchaeum syntrophicum]|uniref:Uncharacterized protein n=1 Tax=Promethearchaeum syntrophicum TaxID=2594042 RepID=A0AC61ZU53_9ARCH
MFLIANTPPTISGVSITPDPAYTGSLLTANPADWVDDDGHSPGYIYRWFLNGTEIGGETDSTLSSTFYVKDDIIIVEVTPYDGFEYGIAVNSVDDDGHSPGYIYRWFLNGTEISGQTGPTLASTFFVKDDIIIVEVTPYDGFEYGIAVNSTELTISNTAPEWGGTTVIILPDPAEITDILTATLVGGTPSDPDGDPTTLYYSWEINGTIVQWTTSDTLGVPFARWDMIRVNVTVSDYELNSTILSDNQTIGNSGPVWGTLDVEITPNPANVTDILNATMSGTGVDPDGDDLILYFQWWINETVVQWGLSDQLTTGYFMWDRVSVRVYLGDGVNNATGFKWDNVTIINTPPSITTVSITPGTAYTESDLTAIPTGWTDDDGHLAGYIYRWFLNGTIISGQIGNTLDSTFFVINDIIIVEVTPFDGYDSGDPVNTTIPLIISNTPPSITGVSINPGTAYTESALTAIPTGWTDADGHLAGYTYRWFLNGTEISGQFGVTLDSNFFVMNDIIIVEVTPFDGYDSGDPVNSTIPLTILNTRPSVTSVSITPGIAYTESDLTAIPTGWTDADGHLAGYSYRWFLNGTEISGQIGNTLDSTFFVMNDIIIVEVTPFDGYDSGDPVNTTIPLIISNSLPTFTTMTITGNHTIDQCYQNNTLVVTIDGWNDYDVSDSENYYYLWRINGIEVLSGVGNEFSSLDGFSVGDEVSIEVWAFDGYENSTESMLRTIQIINSGPFIINVSELQSLDTWTQNEDFDQFIVDLSPYQLDFETDEGDLYWTVEVYNEDLVTISNESNSAFLFMSVLNQYGNTSIIFTLHDDNGGSVKITVNFAVIKEEGENPPDPTIIYIIAGASGAVMISVSTVIIRKKRKNEKRIKGIQKNIEENIEETMKEQIKDQVKDQAKKLAKEQVEDETKKQVKK